MDKNHQNHPDLNNLIYLNEYKQDDALDDMSYADMLEVLSDQRKLQRYINNINDENIIVEIPGEVFAEILSLFVIKEEED